MNLNEVWLGGLSRLVWPGYSRVELKEKPGEWSRLVAELPVGKMVNFDSHLPDSQARLGGALLREQRPGMPASDGVKEVVHFSYAGIELFQLAAGPGGQEMSLKAVADMWWDERTGKYRIKWLVWEGNNKPLRSEVGVVQSLNQVPPGRVEFGRARTYVEEGPWSRLLAMPAPEGGRCLAGLIPLMLRGLRKMLHYDGIVSDRQITNFLRSLG